MDQIGLPHSYKYDKGNVFTRWLEANVELHNFPTVAQAIGHSMKCFEHETLRLNMQSYTSASILLIKHSWKCKLDIQFNTLEQKKTSSQISVMQP